MESQVGQGFEYREENHIEVYRPTGFPQLIRNNSAMNPQCFRKYCGINFGKFEWHEPRPKSLGLGQSMNS